MRAVAAPPTSASAARTSSPRGRASRGAASGAWHGCVARPRRRSLRRLARHRRSCSARPPCRSSHITVRGNERLVDRRSAGAVDGLRGQQHPDRRARRVAGRGCWRRRGSRTRRSAACCRRRSRSRSANGGRSASAASATRSISSTRTASIIDEYGPNYADFDLPIIDGLAAARRLARRRVVDEAPRRRWRRGVIAALQARPDLAERVSQIDVSDAHDAVVMLEGDTALLRLGEERVRRSHAGVSRPGAGAARARVGHRLRGSAVRRTVVREAGRSAATSDAARGRGDVTRSARAEPDRRRSLARQERYVVGLDIGTSKVCTVVGELLDDGGVDVIGLGVAESQGAQARGRRQPRCGRRFHQELDRRSRADGRRRDRHRSTSASAARTSRASTAAASSPSPARTARSRETTCGGRSMRRARCRCPPAARFCTCCRRTSSSTSRKASARRSDSPAPASK